MVERHFFSEKISVNSFCYDKVAPFGEVLLSLADSMAFNLFKVINVYQHCFCNNLLYTYLKPELKNDALCIPSTARMAFRPSLPVNAVLIVKSVEGGNPKE